MRVNRPPHAVQTGDRKSERPDPAPPSVDSLMLMEGRRELIIRHGAVAYRLRLTASNKLILTK